MYVVFDNGQMYLRNPKFLVRLEDGRDVSTEDLRIGDVLRQMVPTQNGWKPRLIRVVEFT